MFLFGLALGVLVTVAAMVLVLHEWPNKVIAIAENVYQKGKTEVQDIEDRLRGDN